MQWDGRHDPFEAAIRKETTCCAAGKSQNETFDEQLANELAASGTKRGAHGNFFFAGSGASEKQVGQVTNSRGRAGNIPPTVTTQTGPRR